MAVCIPAHTCVYEIICVPMYILMDLRWLYAYLDDMHEIIFVRIYIPTHLGRLCALSVCVSQVPYSFVHMCVPTHLGRRPTIPTLMCMKSCFIFPHVLDSCASMLRHTCI